MLDSVVPSEVPVPTDPTAPPRRRKDPAATQKRWVERLQRFGASQRTVAPFCADEGISVPAYYAARRALRAGG